MAEQYSRVEDPMTGRKTSSRGINFLFLSIRDYTSTTLFPALRGSAAKYFQYIASSRLPIWPQLEPAPIEIPSPDRGIGSTALGIMTVSMTKAQKSMPRHSSPADAFIPNILAKHIGCPNTIASSKNFYSPPLTPREQQLQRGHVPAMLCERFLPGADEMSQVQMPHYSILRAQSVAN